MSYAFLHRFPVVLATALAVLGILIDRLRVDADVTGWISLALASVVVLTLVDALVVRWSGKTKPVLRWIKTAVVWTCFFGGWNAWHEQAYQSASVLTLLRESDDALGRPVVVRGQLGSTVTVRHNPLAAAWQRDDISPWQSQLILQLKQIRGGEGFAPLNGQVLVFVDGDQSHFRPGDELEVYGWLRPLSQPSNPGEVDLRPSYRRRDLHGRIETKNATSVTRIKESTRPIAPLIAAIASRGRQSLMRHTDDTTGPLAVALVLGQREFVNPKMRDALLATGTAHLLSVSGMHLAIIVLVVSWCVSALELRTLSRLLVIVLVSALYVAVTGGRPPVMRAAILIAMLLLSTCVRRTSQPLNTLGIAAITLVLINPSNVFSVGVHLSFLAVTTLMLAGRPIAPGSMRSEIQQQSELRGSDGFQDLIDSASSRWFRYTKQTARFFGQMAWLSGCVTVVSLPLVWSQFHLISPVSVITNVMVWGGLMIALPSGVLTVIADFIHPSVSYLPGSVCHFALVFMWSIIRWTQAWPGGHAWLPSPPAVSIVVFYAVMGLSLIWQSKSAKWFRIGWASFWIVSMLFWTTRPAPLPANTLEVTFVDVGHGTCAIVRTPNHQHWLYDCGRMGNTDGTARDIDTALWSLGITHLDGIFLSHADADHYNALPALLERFWVNKIITPPGMLQTPERGLDSIRDAIAQHSIPIIELASGQPLQQMFDAQFTVLHPPAHANESSDQLAANSKRISDNANSLVLRIDQGDRCLLLPGDLEPPGTDILVSGPRPTAGGVLMAPHHGSLSMDADAVLAWARPAETIVSGGRRAAKPEIQQMLSTTGSNVHVTSQVGAIRVRISHNGNIQIRSWLQQPW